MLHPHLLSYLCSKVVLVAELLLAKETITNKDVVSLIGKRPFQQSEVTWRHHRRRLQSAAYDQRLPLTC